MQIVGLSPLRLVCIGVIGCYHENSWQSTALGLAVQKGKYPRKDCGIHAFVDGEDADRVRTKCDAHGLTRL